MPRRLQDCSNVSGCVLSSSASDLLLKFEVIHPENLLPGAQHSAPQPARVTAGWRAPLCGAACVSSSCVLRAPAGARAPPPPPSPARPSDDCRSPPPSLRRRSQAAGPRDRSALAPPHASLLPPRRQSPPPRGPARLARTRSAAQPCVEAAGGWAKQPRSSAMASICFMLSALLRAAAAPPRSGARTCPGAPRPPRGGKLHHVNGASVTSSRSLPLSAPLSSALARIRYFPQGLGKLNDRLALDHRLSGHPQLCRQGPRHALVSSATPLRSSPPKSSLSRSRLLLTPHHREHFPRALSASGLVLSHPSEQLLVR